MRNFSSYGIDTRGKVSGIVKTRCPHCIETRHDKRDRSLRVNIDSGFGHCYHCGWDVHVPDQDEERRKKESWKKNHPKTVPKHFERPVFDPSKMTLTSQWEEYLVNKRCFTQEAISDLKLTVQQVRMPKSGQVESCLCFNYFEDGKLINTKYRTIDKQFKMFTGAELIPYNIDSIKDSDIVIIVEGEMDVLAVHSVGLKNVISVPTGGSSSLSSFDRFKESHFDNKTSIIIAGDMDEVGVKLRQELLTYFGAERCKVVVFGDGCKDANEHLQRYGAESLRIAIAQAKEVELEGVCTVHDINGDFRAIFENGLGSGAQTGWANLDAHCTFELGRFVVVTGVPGSGKSEFTDELVLRLNLLHGWKIGYFSPENVPLAYHLTKLADKLLGHRFQKGQGSSESDYLAVTNFLENNVTHICPDGDATLKVILGKCKELLVRKGSKVFVLDPLNCFDHTPQPNQSETQYLSWFLNQLCKFARRYHCLIILVAHPRKMNRDIYTGKTHRPEMYDINGSADFYNKADFGLVIDRDDDAGLVHVYIDKVKFKNLGGRGAVAFSYDVVSGRYIPLESNDRAFDASTINNKSSNLTRDKCRTMNWLKKYCKPLQDSIYFDENLSIGADDDLESDAKDGLVSDTKDDLATGADELDKHLLHGSNGLNEDASSSSCTPINPINLGNFIDPDDSDDPDDPGE